MKITGSLFGALLVLGAFVLYVQAQEKEITLKGKIVCAKCTLKEGDTCVTALFLARPAAGLRLWRIPFAGGLLRSRSVGLAAFACGKSFSPLPKWLKSQAAQVRAVFFGQILPQSRDGRIWNSG